MGKGGALEAVRVKTEGTSVCGGTDGGVGLGTRRGVVSITWSAAGIKIEKRKINEIHMYQLYLNV